MIKSNVKLGHNSLRNDHDGIVKSIQTKIDQFREIGKDELTLEPIGNEYTEYRSTVIAGVWMCEVRKYLFGRCVANFIAWIE